MKLEDAILHCEEVADRCELTAGNRQCEDEHRQLALWLKDYKRLLEQQKIGKWIDDNCSECGQYVYHGDARNFCPNCGAKMESDNNDI